MAHRKGKRRLFQKAADALEQLESIEKAQQGLRRVKKGERINRIDKSKQRFRNAHRNLRQRDDFKEEYD